MEIERTQTTRTGIQAHQTIASATAINLRGFSGGHIHPTSAHTSTTWTIYACATENGTYTPVKAYTGVAATATGAGSTDEWIELPPSIFSLPFIKLYPSAAGDNGTAHGTLEISLKS